MFPAFFYLMPSVRRDVPQPTIGGTIALWFKRAPERARDRAALVQASELDLRDAV